MTHTHPGVAPVARARHGRRTDRLVSAANLVSELRPIGLILPATESQARELTRLEEPAQQVAAWQAVVDRVDGDARKVTAKLVREEVNRLLPDPDDGPLWRRSTSSSPS